MRRLATGLMAAAALAMLATGVHAQDKQKVKIGTEGAYPPFNSIDTEDWSASTSTSPTPCARRRTSSANS